MSTRGPILFLDDDADVRMAISQSLDLAGFEVRACRAVIEATDHLSPGFPGVVLTDIRMPGKDGFAFLDRCQRMDADLPVVVLTGEGDVPMAVEAMSAGAFGFLEKPCAPQILIETLDRALAARTGTLTRRRELAGGIARIALERGAGQGALATQMEMVEKLLIEAELTHHGGRVAAVAEALGLPRKTLYDKLKRHHLDPAEFRDITNR